MISKWSTRVPFLVGQLCLLKAVYLGILAILLVLWGDSSKFTLTEVRWPRSGPPVFESHFAAWDAAHYLLLSTQGYSEGLPSCAFYPLWPLMLKSFMLLGISPLWGGIIAANITSATAWALFYSIAVRRLGVAIAKLGLILLITYPGAIFFQFPYSESLFLLGVVVLIDSLDRSAPFLALVVAFVLPLTRAIGLFVILPIGVQIVAIPSIQRWRNKQLVPQQESGDSTVAGLTPRFGRLSWGILVAPVFGWVTYLCLMWSWTGNPFEGFVAQKHWGRHSVSNLVNLPYFVEELISPTEWHEFSGSVLDRIVFLPVLLSILIALRNNRELISWIVILGILPAMSGEFTSFTRFGSCAVPCFWLWAEYLSGPRKRLARCAVVVAFTIVHVMLLWRFVNFGWAG